MLSGFANFGATAAITCESDKLCPDSAGHWGRGWHFATHPTIDCLVLSTELKTAIVYFRCEYEGGATLLERRDDKWVVVDRQMTSVE
jgi:hypothetical protein